MQSVRHVLGTVAVVCAAFVLTEAWASRAGEVTDLIFIIDGSSSISGGEYGAFQLEKEGVRTCLCGPDAFLPYDGTVAVAVIQFSSTEVVEIPLTVLDSPATAETVCAALDQITQLGQGSALTPALEAAETIFLISPDALRRFLIVSTDAALSDHGASYDQCRALRAMETPVTIVAIEIDERCSPSGPEADFLKNCANTADAEEYDPADPEGCYGCAQDLADLDAYAALCRDCVCPLINEGGTDCDGNGVPDRCETDCNNNGVLDECDIRDGVSEDCTGNGIPDECEPDCNENGIADSCDIAAGASSDCNENGIPDECELGACCDDDTGLCTENVTECDCAGRWTEGAVCDPDPFTPPCGTSACCEPNGSCHNLTEEECDALGGFWDEGYACGGPCQNCGLVDVCLDGEGECAIPRPVDSHLVGCNDRCCCIAQCEQDPYCCQYEWDQNCASNSLFVCDLPPLNDVCWDADPQHGAQLVDVPSSGTMGGVLHATEDPSDPGFCCYGNAPGTTGVGTIWYKFIAPQPSKPEDEFSSVQLSTCCSAAGEGAPADDSLLQIFRVRNPDRGVCDDGAACSVAAQDCVDDSTCVFDEQWACNNLITIGCNDDAGDACTCGLGTQPNNSKLCAAGLVPGQTYYAIVVARADRNRGVYRLDVRAYCSSAPLSCPAGEVNWIDPLDGVVDARQPHTPDNANRLSGIDAIVVGAPVGADDPCCWTLCETNENPHLHPSYLPEWERNEIVGVICGGDDTCTVTLKRPIAPGEATTITYTDENGAVATGRFVSHPANVNGDSQASPSDILRMIDYLNGVDVPPWGLYSEDVDHSGLLAPPDILRVIDLLNGAGEFETWINTPLPDCGDCCP